jgi:hypothetical protein
VNPKVREDLAVVDIDGESVIYDLQEDMLYHLNASAAMVFHLCDGTGTVDEVAQDITEVGGLPAAEVLDQVVHMVHHFANRGLLEGSVATWNREEEQEGMDETPDDRDQLVEQETQNH